MQSLQVVFHAPTAQALDRARRNLVNFQAIEPQAELRLVVNGGAVQAALDNPDPATDGFVFLCRNTLERQGLQNNQNLAEVDAAVVELAWLQAKGWQYIRA